ncbi:MAG: hypothetical protein AAGC95_16410 [Pseudomonadota bacterium]
MLNNFISDVIGAFQTIFLQGDIVMIAVAVAIVLILAFVQRGLGHILTMGVLALVLFGAANVIRAAVATPGAEASASPWVSQLESGWTNFTAMSAGTLVSYMIVFALAIFIVSAVKGAVLRD